MQYEPPVSCPLTGRGVSVRCENICRDVRVRRHGTKRILDSISLTVGAGELTAIVGGSGTGKSTLMNCLNGFEPPTCGHVYIDGQDLTRNYALLKSRIGYVPQADTIHGSLSVGHLLRYAAQLRLSRFCSPWESEKKVENAMRSVGLTQEKEVLVSKLSGGQRKRVSIAVELVSDPPLFFLDEPTSGLDPEAETTLMKQLRTLSHDRGKTVICITHTLQNIALFDKLIFLAPGGRLCFFGTPAQALSFFEVDNLADAYELIRRDPDRYVSACALLTGGQRGDA